MNWDQVQGNWKDMKGKARQRWGDLTDDDMEQINGNRDQLVGKLQEKYGMAREEAEKAADSFAQESESATP